MFLQSFKDDAKRNEKGQRHGELGYQLDDVVIVALVFRSLLRGGGEPLVREHWSGPDSLLALVLRLAT